MSYKVSRAEDSDGWVTDAVGSETSARIIDADSLDELLKALGCVVAESVEVLSASDEDLARCGLDVPAIELAVDSAEANVVRQKLLFGKAAPGGGRYVTVGGSDAIFIISAKAMRVLTAPLVK